MNCRFSDIDARVCVIIPTYNNAGSVADVVRRTYSVFPRVIVVNDGSTDTTLKCVKDCVEELGGNRGTDNDSITIVSYDQNRGKGYALVQGFHKAMELGYDYAITLDADGQHFPEDIPVLLEVLYHNPDSLIVGSRDLKGKKMSRGSAFANKFSNFWFAVQTACPLPDTQTGYRLYPLHHLHWLNLITSRYESELELMVFASWHGVKLISVPINVYYPAQEDRVSHFRPGPDFARISLLNTILCFGAFFYGYPRKLCKGIYAIIATLIAIIIFLFGSLMLSLTAFLFKTLYKNSKKHQIKFHKLLNASSMWVVKHIPGVSYTLNNIDNETFKEPAMIICNHQSHIDLMCILALTPNLVILTKNWVWNNPFYGLAVRYADFYPVTLGYEQTIDYCREKVKQGYSIMVYPEGTRSEDCNIGRFHKGAFYMAQELELDIIPVIEYGPGKVLPKTGMYFRKGHIEVDIHPRIKPNDTRFGENYKQRAKRFERFYKEEYVRLSHRKFK